MRVKGTNILKITASAAVAAVLLVVVPVSPVTAAEKESGGWARQFGTRVADEALGVALDGAGNAYVAGWTFGTLAGQRSAGMVDAFVRKYDAAGREVWTRQFGSAERDFARAVAADGVGNAYVVGETWGSLPGQRSAGGYDAFVRRYDPAGTEVWTRQFGGGGGEGAWGVAIDPAGGAYVVGTTRAALPGQAPAGGFDAFVARYDAAGNQVWAAQFGTPGDEGGHGVALDPSGNVLVVGSTDLVLPGETSAGGFDAYLRQYDSTGREGWTRQFGSPADDFGVAVAVDAGGNAVVAGSADQALPGQTWAGGTDAFLRSFDGAGATRWTNQFGTTSTDAAWGVAIDRAGRTHVVGSTERELPGQRTAGGTDIFVRRYAGGREVRTHQFGTERTDMAYAVAVDDTGARLVGSTSGALAGRDSTSTGDRDAIIVMAG
ncbi:MAG: SBBP repeat-containing protein [Acidimicrobiia bacterium]